MAEDIVTLGFSFSAGNAESEIAKLIKRFDELAEKGSKTQQAIAALFPARFSSQVRQSAELMDKFTASLEITSAKAVETSLNLQKLKVDPGTLSPAPLTPVGDELERLTKKAKGAGIAFASVFTTAKLISFGKMTVAEFAAGEQAIDRMTASLRRAGVSISAFLPQFRMYADELQSLTRFRNTDIMGDFSRLANFNIPVERIRDAEKAAIGLAAAYDIKLGNAVKLIGRAYAGSYQALSDYGIVLQSTGGKEEKFNELLRLGAENFQLAEADARNFAGSMAQLNNTWKSTSEIIGGTFAPAIQSVGSGLQSMLAGFNRMEPAAQRFVVQFGTVAAGAVALRTALAGLNLIQAQSAKLTDTAALAEKSRLSVRELEAQVSLKQAQSELAEGESIRRLNALIAAETAERQARLAVRTAEQNVAAAKTTGSKIEIGFAKGELGKANAELSRMTANLQAAQVESAKANLATVKAAASLKAATAALEQESAAVVKNAAAKRSAITAFLGLGTAAQAGGAKVAASAVAMNLAKRATVGLAATLRTAGTALKSFAAALGPIGWGLLALQGITAIYDALDLSGKRLTASFDNQISGLDRMREQIERTAQQTEQYAASAKSGIASLQELARYDKLTATGQQAAGMIVQELNAHYKDLGITYDATTGKIIGLDGANARLTETYRQQIAAQSRQALLVEQDKLNALRSKENSILSEKMSLIDLIFRSSALEEDTVSRIQANSAEIVGTMQRIGELKQKIAQSGKAEIDGQAAQAQAALQVAQREAQLRQQLADKQWKMQFDNGDALQQLNMVRQKIADITAARTAAEQAIAGKMATPEGEKQSWEEKRLQAEMQLLDLQKQEGGILVEAQKTAEQARLAALKQSQAQADKLAQSMRSAWQSTVRMVQENDKFKATTATAVNANSIQAMELQSRRFDAMPDLKGMTSLVAPGGNLATSQNALAVSTAGASNALTRFAALLQALPLPGNQNGGQGGGGLLTNNVYNNVNGSQTYNTLQPVMPQGVDAGDIQDLSKIESGIEDVRQAIAESNNPILARLDRIIRKIPDFGTVQY